MDGRPCWEQGRRAGGQRRGRACGREAPGEGPAVGQGPPHPWGTDSTSTLGPMKGGQAAGEAARGPAGMWEQGWHTNRPAACPRPPAAVVPTRGCSRMGASFHKAACGTQHTGHREGMKKRKGRGEVVDRCRREGEAGRKDGGVWTCPGSHPPGSGRLAWFCAFQSQCEEETPSVTGLGVADVTAGEPHCPALSTCNDRLGLSGHWWPWSGCR